MKQKIQSDLLLKVWEAMQRQEPAYLAVIQRFRAGGDYVLYNFTPDRESACRELSNSGQRYPGFAIQCLQMNDPNVAMVHGVQSLERFVLHIGSPIVLGHAPVASYENATGRRVTISDSERGEVLWVGNPKQSTRAGRGLLSSLHSAAVLGLVVCIEDSETGAYISYHQDNRDAIGWGKQS